MIYKGKGFIVGVPARNLSAQEVKAIGKERLLSSGLYFEKRSKEIVKEEKNDERN